MRISDWSSDVCSSDLAVPLVRRLMKEAGVVPTGGATGANRFNLSGPWLAAMQRIYGGTRLGRQELDGAMLEDVEGALWTRALLERSEEHTSEPQALMRTSYAVSCLKHKNPTPR